MTWGSVGSDAWSEPKVLGISELAPIVKIEPVEREPRAHVRPLPTASIVEFPIVRSNAINQTESFVNFDLFGVVKELRHVRIRN